MWIPLKAPKVGTCIPPCLVAFPKQDIDALGKYWNVFPGLRQRLFAEENGHSARLAVQDVRETVNADSGVSAYIQRYREVFTDYPAYLRDELVGNAANVSIAAEEEVLAHDLLHRLTRYTARRCLYGISGA